MIPKLEIVTQEKAARDKATLILGLQFGLFGFIFRVGLYY